MRLRVELVACALALAVGATVHAAPPTAKPGRIMPLERLPGDKLVGIAPLLRHGDMALIESNKDGTMKQVTLMMFVAAPAKVVHDVIASPGDYKNYVPNVTQSTVKKLPDGKLESVWRMKLPISEFDGINVYEFEPGPTGAIFLHAIDPNDDATYRWELYDVPGGTVAVQYGYTDVKHSNSFVQRFLKRQPTMEHGLALAAQLIMVEAFKREAEKRVGPQPKVDPGKGGNFNFLLDRGQVAIMRTDDKGKLQDASVMDRVFATKDKIMSVLNAPGEFSRVIAGVDKAYIEGAGKDGTTNYYMEMSLPIVTWATSFSQRSDAKGVEGIGIKGDLGGSHYRWDLVPRGDAQTLTIYRVNQKVATNLLVRKLFQYEPTLEHGVNVALGLVLMRGIRGAAEGWPAATR